MKRELKPHCQEVYGPGEWGHCLRVAREMCLWREKMAAYTGNDFLDIHPSRFTFGKQPSVFWANVMLFLLLLIHMNPSSQGYTVGQRERWVFLSVVVVGDNSCSCCQECRFFLLLRMYNTHESPLHPVIGNIHLLVTTCWIFMSGDVGMYALKNTLLVWALTSGSGANTAATSRKSEWVINNC